MPHMAVQYHATNGMRVLLDISGVEELEKRRQSLAEEAELKNSHLKSVIDKLRTILAAIDSWNE